MAFGTEEKKKFIESKNIRASKMGCSQNSKITRKIIILSMENEKVKPAKAITRKSQSNQKKRNFFFTGLIFFLLAVMLTAKIQFRQTFCQLFWDEERNNRWMFQPLEIIMWMASVFAIVPLSRMHMENGDQWPTCC